MEGIPGRRHKMRKDWLEEQKDKIPPKRFLAREMNLLEDKRFEMVTFLDLRRTTRFKTPHLVGD